MEDAALYIGEKARELSKEAAAELVERVREGRDAPMTDEIYGRTPVSKSLLPEVLPEATGEINGPMTALQRFINMYQPSELVMRNNFRKHLLQVLEEWKEQDENQRSN